MNFLARAFIVIRSANPGPITDTSKACKASSVNFQPNKIALKQHGYSNCWNVRWLV